MDFKKLCLALLAAESEADVEKILNGHNEFHDQGNWRLLIST